MLEKMQVILWCRKQQTTGTNRSPNFLLWCKIVHSKLWMGARTQCNLLMHFIGFRSPNLHALQPTMHFIYFLLVSHAPHWVMRSGSCLTAIADIKINLKFYYIFRCAFDASFEQQIMRYAKQYAKLWDYPFCIEWLAALLPSANFKHINQTKYNFIFELIISYLSEI